MILACLLTSILLYSFRVRIGIAGPGRSGTSLLTKLFLEFGFTTPALEGTFFEDAQAGYESRIDATSNFEIDKDPWLFEYINSIPDEVIGQYELILIPIRNRQDAIISRVSQERGARAVALPSTHWTWNSWGTVAGGAVSGTDFESINQTLSSGLWDLVETCERRRIPYKFIHFPKFAEDFDYFWSALGSIVGTRTSKQNSKEIFDNVVDLGKIRIDSQNFESSKVAELEAVISILQKKIHGQQEVAERDALMAERDALMAERDALMAERDALMAERDALMAERDAVTGSTIWNLFAPYRKFIRFVQGN
jgi:hypothetical protein